MKNLKNNIIFVAIFLITFLSMIFTSTNFVSAGTPAIRVTLVNQDPSPANPGKYVDIKFQIENIGDDIAPGVFIELVPNYPFSLDSNENAQKVIGSMQAGRLGKDSVLVTYKVRVDDKAVQGNNEIEVRYKKSENDAWTSQKFNVAVENLNYIISIESVNTIPEELKPGEKAKIEIKVKNLGFTTIKDLSLKMVLSAYNGNSLVNLIPIAPTSSSSEKKIDFLEPNKEETIVFDVIVEPEASSNIYKVPIVLTYYDSLNQEKNINDIIGIIIGSSPELSYQITNSEIISAGTKGKIKIDIVNKGLANANFLNIIPKETKKFNLISTQNEIYIGSIDSDDYETFELEMFVNNNVGEEIEIPFEVTYKDQNNKEYSEDINLPLRIYSPEKAKELGLVKPQSFPFGWIILVIVIIGFIVFRSIKKKRK